MTSGGPSCLLVSDREQDLAFGRRLAEAAGYGLHVANGAVEAERLLAAGGPWVALFDGDREADVVVVAEAVRRRLPVHQVFLICDQGVNAYPHLLAPAAFSHVLQRRFGEPAPELYAQVARATSTPFPLGIERYFTGEPARFELELARAHDKLPSLEKVREFLEGRQVTARLVQAVLQAVDELLMNALFDAPVDDVGRSYRRQVPRDQDFPLDGREKVRLQVMANDRYVAVSVTDQFGSLNRDKVLGHLGQNFSNEDYQSRVDDAGAGLGLFTTVQTGLSLLFGTSPGERTDVMVFFPHSASFREFREGFRFISIRAE
jgi:hypothetical protein